MNEMVFSPGDIVVLTKDHPDDNETLVAGCTGTVLRDQGDISLSNWVNVCWDKEIDGGHNCEGLCRHGYGWNVPREALRLFSLREIKKSDVASEKDLIALFQMDA